MKRLAVLAMFAMVVGCLHKREVGDPQSTDNLITGSWDVKIEPVEVDTVERSDPSCTADQALPFLGSAAVVELTNDGKTDHHTFNLADIAGNGLKNKYLSGVVVGFHRIESYGGCQLKEKNLYTCSTLRTTVANRGDFLPICKNERYRWDSIEGAALAAVSGISSTARFYETVPNHSTRRKIEVLLFPKMETRVEVDGQTLSTYATDNAHWSTAQRDGDPNIFSISILNHSKARKKVFKHLLWEQLGVAGHELGHHYCYETAVNLFAADFKIQNFSHPDADDQDTEYPLGSGPRVVDRELVRNMIGEGFADLISHYAFDSGKLAIGKLSFGYYRESRDVLSGKNEGKDPKVFSAEFLKRLFSHVRITKPEIHPDPQDVHTGGAVFAYLFDSLVKLKVGATEEAPKSALKARFLIEFINAINANSKNMRKDPRGYLEDILWEAVNIAMIKDGVLSNEQCEIIKDRLPVYKWDNRYSCR